MDHQQQSQHKTPAKKKKKTILSQPLLRRVHQATQVRISKLVTGRGIIVKSEKISGWLLDFIPFRSRV